MRRFITLNLILISFPLFAREIRYPMRSPRGLLMGDAFTAVSKDEYAIFYNPAALARHHGFNFSTINPVVSIPDITGDKDKFNDMSDTASGISQELMNYPLHLGAGIVSGLRFESFSMMAYSTSQTNLLLVNPTSPEMDIDYRLDNGFVVSYAWALGSSRLNKKGQGHQYSMGISAHYVKRREINQTYPLFGTEVLNTIAADPDKIGDLIDELNPSVGKAWGYDVGFEYFINSGINQLVLGFSALDIMDTKFDTDEPIDDQKMSLSAGLAWSQDLGLLKYTFALDYHPILSPIEEGRKIHLGTSLEFGNLEFLAGYNGGYYSYGVGIDLWLFEIYAGFYEIEIGNKFREKKSERALIYFNLAELEFDF